MPRQHTTGLVLLFVAVMILGSVTLTPAQDQKSEVAGTWKRSQEGPDGQIEFILKLTYVTRDFGGRPFF